MNTIKRQNIKKKYFLGIVFY